MSPTPSIAPSAVPPAASPAAAAAKPIQAASLFALLGDPTRLQLLVTLRSGTARPIARLATQAGMTRQAVTKHLRLLERAGLVSRTSNGRETHYRYVPGTLDTARRYLDAIAGRWDALPPVNEPNLPDR